MEITINTPSIARVEGNLDEISNLNKQLEYIRDSIRVLLGKHKSNRWFKSSNPDQWEWRLKELQSQLKGTCLYKDNKGHFIRPGTISYIESIDLKVHSNVLYPELKSFKWTKEPEFTPYPYQSASVEKLIAEKHGNVSLPTGSGKSLILLLLTKKMGLRTVIITPSKSIFNELLTEFQIRLGKDRVGGYGDGKKDIKKPITIAIGKSLANLKEGTEAYDFFKNKESLMVDESHVFGASQLESVCHGVLGDIPYRLFVSATQTRGDGTKKLLQSIIGKTVYEMSIKDAIDQKYLCPLKYLVISTYSSSTSTKRDPIEAKRAHFLRNELIAEKIAKLANAVYRANNQSTLILVEELRQISMLQDLIEAPFGYVHSGSKKDAAEWGLEKVKLQDQVDAFNEGKIKVLVGTRAIATGTNMYAGQYTVNWVGGKSEIITKQGAMGRSTRKLEISKYKDFHPPKPFTTIIDFRVLDNDIMERQLLKRLEYYSESGGEIKQA